MAELFNLIYEGVNYSYDELTNAAYQMTPEVFAKKVVLKALTEKNFSDAFVGINKAVSLTDSEYISAVVDELDNELIVFKFGYEEVQYFKMLLIGDSLLPYRNCKKQEKPKKKKTKKHNKRR